MNQSLSRTWMQKLPTKYWYVKDLQQRGTNEFFGTVEMFPILIVMIVK